MRSILILLCIFILNGCEKNTQEQINIPNSNLENEKAQIIFKRCHRCHGIKGQKAALTKSDIIANYSKNGKRDRHRFGFLMKGIIADLSKDDIRILADYISNIQKRN